MPVQHWAIGVKAWHRDAGRFPTLIIAPQPNGLGAKGLALEGLSLLGGKWATLKFKAQKRGSAKLAKIVRVSLAKIALCGYVKGNWARNRWGKVAR